jgi:hypothetical protein
MEFKAKKFKSNFCVRVFNFRSEGKDLIIAEKILFLTYDASDYKTLSQPSLKEVRSGDLVPECSKQSAYTNILSFVFITHIHETYFSNTRLNLPDRKRRNNYFSTW